MGNEIVSQSGLIIEDSRVEKLRYSLRGQSWQRGEAGYDEVRKVWNGMIDKHPSLYVKCAGVADVISCVDFARHNDILVAVRGGGHNVAGNAVCDNGLVIDLSLMKGIRVDPVSRTVNAQGGVTWKDLDNETQALGLAVTGGLVSSTGIAGLTLGGGFGWLARKFGLACDNLISADIVTADGRFISANQTENSDLFWGIRGGGGNFGIVTSFTYKLHPVTNVLAGMAVYPLNRSAQVLRFYREFIQSVPDDLSTVASFMTIPALPFIPAQYHGQKVFAILLCHAGKVEDGERLLDPFFNAYPPELNIVSSIRYSSWQQILDPAAPKGLLNYWKASFLKNLNDETIDLICNAAETMPVPFSRLDIHHMLGAIGRVGEEETAYSFRSEPFLANFIGIWSDPDQTERNIKWVRDLAKALNPGLTSGVYVNFLGQEGYDRVREAYSENNFRRLVRLKNKYDPGNFFRINQNIRPEQI